MNQSTPVRVPAMSIDPQFINRWSPRSFVSDILSPLEIATLFEAARWSPSCNNDQPWEFRYAVSTEARKRFCETLKPRNQLWACRAPLLVYVCARTLFSKTDSPNRHAAFDAGAATMALMLQARTMGLYTHAMAGFELEKAYTLLNLDKEKYLIMAAVAVGKIGPADALEESFRAMEQPNDRNVASSFIKEI